MKNCEIWHMVKSKDIAGNKSEGEIVENQIKLKEVWVGLGGKIPKKAKQTDDLKNKIPLWKN